MTEKEAERVLSVAVGMTILGCCFMVISPFAALINPWSAMLFFLVGAGALVLSIILHKEARNAQAEAKLSNLNEKTRRSIERIARSAREHEAGFGHFPIPHREIN